MISVFYISLIGFAAGALNIIAYIPQVIKAARTKSTKDLSVSWLIFLSAAFALWIVYGIELNSFPILIANIAFMIVSLTLLSLKLNTVEPSLGSVVVQHSSLSTPF